MTHYNPYKWHFIKARQVPSWIVHRFGVDADEMASEMHGSTITETVKYAKGKHYEYKWVVVTGGHTHDNAVIRRKLKHHSKEKNKK